MSKPIEDSVVVPRGALLNLQRAAEFYKKVLEASNAGEDCTSTGAWRDADQWLKESALALAEPAVLDAAGQAPQEQDQFAIPHPAGTATECRECGGSDLFWETHYTTYSGVQQGRLRTSEVKCLFVLGCNYCSETLKIVSAEELAATMPTRRVQESDAPAPQATALSTSIQEATQAETFKRDERYIVIKRSDLDTVARDDVREQFCAALDRLNAHDIRIPQRQYVVVESDWPEYEPVWAMLKARVAREKVEPSTRAVENRQGKANED